MMQRCLCRWLPAMMTTVMLVQPDVDGEGRTQLTLSKTSRRGEDAWTMKSAMEHGGLAELSRRLGWSSRFCV